MKMLYIGIITGFLAGSFGYIVFRFLLKPVISYKYIKKNIIKNIKYFEDENFTIDKTSEGCKNLNQNAKDLSEFYDTAMPVWYKTMLNSNNEDAYDIVNILIKITSSTKKEHITKHIKELKNKLTV